MKLKEILHQVAQDFKAQIIELEVMPDHVHLLIEIDTQFVVNRLINCSREDLQGYYVICSWN